MNEEKYIFSPSQGACVGAAVTFSFLYSTGATVTAAIFAVMAASAAAVLIWQTAEKASFTADVFLSALSLFPFAAICRALSLSLSLRGNVPLAAAAVTAVFLAAFLASPAVSFNRACFLFAAPTAVIFFISLALGSDAPETGGEFYRGAFILFCSGTFSAVLRGAKSDDARCVFPMLCGIFFGGASYVSLAVLGAANGIVSALALWTVLAFGAAGSALPVFASIKKYRRR